jgi:hypothetical protein
MVSHGEAVTAVVDLLLARPGEAVVAAKAAVICQIAVCAEPAERGKRMILARHEVASGIVHSAVCSGAARHSTRCRLARDRLLAIASS